MKAKFFKCKDCGNVVMSLAGADVAVEGMQEVTANSTDAAQEKHVPEVTVSGDKVCVVVGSTVHPMTEEHYIQWIYLETEKGGQVRQLTPADEPKAEFVVAEGDKAVCVYELCNLHGLWKKAL